MSASTRIRLVGAGARGVSVAPISIGMGVLLVPSICPSNGLLKRGTLGTRGAGCEAVRWANAGVVALERGSSKPRTMLETPAMVIFWPR